MWPSKTQFRQWRCSYAHTCLELSSRILSWKASCAQKQSSYTWQEWVSDETRKLLRSYHRQSQCCCHSQCGWHSQKCWHNQIAKTVQVKRPSKRHQRAWKWLKKRRGGSWVGHVSLKQLHMNIEAGTSFWRPRMILQFSPGVFVGLSPVEKP